MMQGISLTNDSDTVLGALAASTHADYDMRLGMIYGPHAFRYSAARIRFLTHIAVVPAARRHGLGTALLLTSIAMVHATRVRKLVGFVQDEDRTAVPFYKRNDFTLSTVFPSRLMPQYPINFQTERRGLWFHRTI